MSNPNQSGIADKLADYNPAASTATALVFRYTVQAADEDTNGIWVGDQSRTLKLDPDDRILTASNNSLPASLTHDEKGTLENHKVDGSRDTASPSVMLTLSDDEIEEGDTATVTASVDPVHDAAFTVAVAGMSDDDARWEFVGSATTLTFAADHAASTGSVRIRAIPNDIDDGDVSITLTGTPSVAAVAAPADVVLTVLDDDLPTVSIAAPTGATDGFLYEFEAATEDLQYQWSLTRVGLTDAALTVDVSVAETGGGDFAADGADTVTFDAGESTTSYTPITKDDVDEDHGTVTVTVTDGTDYDVDPGAASAEVDVRDDDGELVTVTLDPTTLTVNEGRQAQFHAEAETEADTFDDVADMTRLFGTLTQASVEASTEASTGTGAATADTDYTALAAETVELPFADFEPGSGGVLRLRVALPAIATTEDEVTDPDETFKVKLAAPTGQDARIVVSTTAATVTIDDGPPDGAIRLCSGDRGKHLHGRRQGAREQEHRGPGGGDQRRRVGHGVRRLLEQRRRQRGLHADGLRGGGACVLQLALRRRRERHPDVAGQPAVRRRRGRSARLPTARQSRSGGPQLQRRRSARGGRRGALPGGGDGGTRREGGPVDADDRAGRHGALLGVADEASVPEADVVVSPRSWTPRRTGGAGRSPRGRCRSPGTNGATRWTWT